MIALTAQLKTSGPRASESGYCVLKALACFLTLARVAVYRCDSLAQGHNEKQIAPREVIVVRRLMLALLCCWLSACETLRTTAATGTKTHVEFKYRQYAPDAEGICGRSPTTDSAVAPIVEALFAWIAGKAVDGLKNAADRELKRYASERKSDSLYFEFYNTSFWKPFALQGLQASCFEVSQRVCDVPTDAGPDAACKATTPDRLALRGIYLLSDGWLKVLPLHLEVRGVAPERHSSGQTISLGATLTLEAVWVESLRGRQEQLFEADLTKAKYVPQFDKLKVVLEVKQDQEFLNSISVSPPLPRPPKSSSGQTQVRATITVAEVSRAPAVLRWAASFLGEKRDDISKSLAAAMDSL